MYRNRTLRSPAAANGGTVSHHVQITGLTPGTSYFYECGDDAAGFSPVLNFTTSVAVGGEFPVEILAWADSELAPRVGERSPGAPRPAKPTDLPRSSLQWAS